jgi:hypothetical protein
MATFHPYAVEGYGSFDTRTITTLNGVDLGSRPAGDVLTEMMYAGPDGSVNPALYRGCSGPGTKQPVPEDRLAALRDPSGRYALAADPKAIAHAQLESRRQELLRQGPVQDGSRVKVDNAPARPRYSAAGVVPGVTPCECVRIQQRAVLDGGLQGNASSTRARFERDFHANDPRWFSDGNRVLFEFLDMANASTLSLALTRAGVLAPPPFPLRVLAGRSSPCACSLLGPELVHRAYQYLQEDLERLAIDRYGPRDRTMGAVLAQLNRRVTEYFTADQAMWALGDGFVGRARAMAEHPKTHAGTWDYEPLAATRPSRGRLTKLTGEDGGVTEVKRAVASKVAARYGFVLGADGQLY